jgi:hypothetical protein
LVCQGNANDVTAAGLFKTAKVSALLATKTNGSTSTPCQAVASGVPFISEALSNHNLSSTAQHILMSSWRTGTLKQYQTQFIKWKQYCLDNHIDPFNSSVEHVIEFLVKLFDSGLGYSSINTARSALSAILPLHQGFKIGDHPLVSRFLKGVFELRPALPKYNEVWNVNVVLDHLRSYKLAEELSLKELTLKLTMLLCLLTAQRCQTIHLMDIGYIQELEDRYRVGFGSKLKQTKPGHHLAPMELLAFPSDRKLCVVEHLRTYLRRTKEIRGVNTQLLLSFVKPVSKDTIARWIKMVLKLAGIDITKYSAHSSRAASTSLAKSKGLTLQEVMKCAGWSSDTTFAKFYNKPIQASSNFSTIVLGT